MGVESISDELYGVAPEDFVARRREEVARAKAAGDKTLAALLSKLARPTTSAWLVNLLVRHESAMVDDLLAVGAALRDAQSNLAADALRELSARRRDLIAGLGAAVKRLATDAGRTVSDGAGREVGDTLEAAVADPAAADAVRSGRLTRPLRYAGFGPVDVADSVSAPVRHLRPGKPVGPVGPVKPVIPESSGELATDKPAEAQLDERQAHERQAHERQAHERQLDEQRRYEQAVRAARQAVIAATRQAAERRAERDDDEVAARAARNRLAELDQRLAELKVELERAQRERSVAQDAARATEQRAVVSAGALEQAEQAAAHANDEFERLAPDARTSGSTPTATGTVRHRR